ncbi:tRNA (adenosine(37)-N6)-threonylcarbamoyltransferase complex dimerization subunit type 1 TsaB [Fusobacterium nucleatum subsp. nucleatum ATCC 25586]|uniref:O-sialoglycoprotein endopeptidase n=1 Tax=Fusobacterium nucleatum subsp. nucleatum (strain ATCC 25586 / DSM 15643 / BCRC 10681 / CIP 101130 / JCM 8532 / KCTC 2640 / LMG 13131 / VPI 4355) TaxID=190304 RepID=Q8RF02_FUSNN|nr:tRNA (adenosine(37)-N6)-threonylcarbamoyltransferase complex dimerization subunit type 1 TsaB [Fusobacterium nucleatum]AAL95124.1 O-sialoglycoprotein endopeptidase [Fusobacterium nucleatum subsp. nucleatum ATCC 25586]AVQ15292.1 tRNA (adenosine(37)-N6)-threonylcarbamoyltransferase complex dimerization subunit type 1 TsaB [Fusobacterium nucleatum subsp. nucleatum ATCC 25586]WMS30210.1 tRNA (adenosine(37)-N6)-threonylcarbamoyltransferase complex dimerization subunit type 1 TsaB [Fusobacterium nu
MLILGIDTSTKICTCSIFDSENGVIAETSLSVKKNHSNIVMPIIDNLFKISDLTINDIDKIAVAIGPGSFTGVRIALGIAKGLAMALNKPLIAINELDILEAIASGNENEIIPLIDARKERVYYKYQNKYVDDYLINLTSNFDKNKKYIFVGDGAINYKNILKDNLGENAIILPMYNSFPRASILCELALNKEEANIYTLEPEYISKSRAEKHF